MANVQKQFEQFHETVKLKRFGENEVLREKRDIIRNKLTDRLPKVFEGHEEECPKFYFLDQGSYDIGTGTKPLDGDFDIDQGLYFDVSTTAYPDPVVLKKRVHEALNGHTKEVRIRRSCVTVYYQGDDEPLYHVDVAVYSEGSRNADGKARLAKPQAGLLKAPPVMLESRNADGKARLAKGKENSGPDYRIWEISDPQGLAAAIFARFEGNDREQFRRVVRYLKRWKDENFTKDGNGAPLGIGLTAMAYDDLQVAYTDIVAGKADDLAALRKLVRAVLNRFTWVWNADDQKWVQRLAVALPVEPGNDLFERMTDKQMEELKGRLEELLGALDAASDEVDPVEACKRLQKVFGKDFPVPAKEETGKRHAPAIVSSSNSA